MAEMPERDAALLLDMLLAARDAQGFVEGVDEAAFLASRLHQNAAIRSLEVLGEAAGKVSAATRVAYPEIPWREITGMRHRLIHGYGEVRLDLVWMVLCDRLGPLIVRLAALVPDDSENGRPLDVYQLIVVDEAHNYRNPDTPTRAAVLHRLLFGRPRDVLLLTATPVNNSLWDLFHLIRFFARQDAFLADRGVLSVYDRFHQAMREDPSNLSPDLLYPIIDATCVKRTRQFVKKHYSGDTIKGPDGWDHPIVFPQPRAITVRYKLDNPLPQLFDQIESALDPDGGRDALTFARYTVESFLLGDHDADTEAQAAATIGLIRSGLLKRFESSAFAFMSTLDTLIHGHKVFLEALGKGHVVTTRFLREVAPDDETTLDDLLEASSHTLPARDFDTKKLRKAVEDDFANLIDLRARAEKPSPERDPKLKVLVAELEKIAAQAKDEATDAIDEAQRRKVLLFSFFADTVKYVRKYLRREVDQNPALAAYRNRVIAVTGGDDLEDISRQEALYGFAPVSTEAPPGRDADLYDLLVTTDVLAEGVNLQQCRNIINLDVPGIRCA